MDTNAVRLKNGAIEYKSFVDITMLSLMNLLNDGYFIALCELSMKCKDDNHKLFGSTSSILLEKGLVEPGDKVHSSIRNVVLSAVKVNGFDIHLVSPFSQEETE